ncbi:MAG: amino acid adenylation domain-containing protein [Propionibacteriaceae bacterium]|jgi:enterobactin synthetase component F|nr:amino acid adenylation domain-containing protein [Propionibacteriaceae bacterium]
MSQAATALLQSDARPTAGDQALGPRPLTLAQQGVWFAQLRNPESTAYRCLEQVDLSGPIDRDCFAAAIAAAHASLPQLGAVFGEGGDGEPHQRLPGRPQTAVEHIDLSGHADPSSAALALAAARRGLPVDPATGEGMVRHLLVRRSADAWTWFVQIHHILADAAAFAILEKFVASAYSALAQGRPLPPAPPHTLDQRLAAEADYRHGPARAADRDYWAKWAAEHPMSAEAWRPAGPPLRTAVDFGALEGWTAWAAERGVSWAQLAPVIFADYANAVGGTPGRPIGMASMGRDDPGAAAFVGTAVDILPFAAPDAPDLDLAGLATACGAELATLAKHRRYRSEWLPPTHSPLGLPILNLKPFTQRLAFAGIPASVRFLAAGPVRNLELTVFPAAGRLAGYLEVEASRCDEAELARHAARLERRFRLVSTASAANPGGPGRKSRSDQVYVARPDAEPAQRIGIAELPLTTLAEEREGAECLAGPTVGVPQQNLSQWLTEGLTAEPEAPAVTFAGTRWNYARLGAAVAGIEARLAAAGVRPGEIVGVCVERSFELIAAVLAVLRSGAVYFPLDPDQPPARLAQMVRRANPAAVLTTCGGQGFALAPTIQLEPEPAEARSAAAPVSDWPVPALDPLDPAYVLFTSGSTGEPKGAVIPHQAITNRLAWMQDAFPIGPGSRVAQKTPIGFDVSVWELVWPFLVGAHLIVAAPGGHRDPGYLIDYCLAQQVEVIHFVPSMLRALLGHPRAAALASVLRRVVCSGEALDAELANRAQTAWPKTAIENLYGPTEAAIDVTWWHCRGIQQDPIPIGRPVWNTQLQVVDPLGRLLPQGAMGELLLGGVQIGLGYLDNPEATAKAFIADGRSGQARRGYRTGDLARWRADGAVEYCGRRDGQLKINGQRVELGEIEAALAAAPQVDSAVAVHSADGGGTLVGYVRMASGAAFDEAALRAAAGERIAAALVPAQLVAVDDWPVTVNGKLDRSRLPKPSRAKADSQPLGGARPATAPKSPVEELIARAMAEVLETGALGNQASFFDAGANSLDVARLVGRLHGLLGEDVPITTVYAHPSPARLAAALGSGTAVAGPPAGLTWLRGGPAARNSLVWVHPAGGLSWVYARANPFVPAAVSAVGLNHPGLADPASANLTVAELAVRHWSALAEAGILPAGREAGIRLAGWSFGGVVAQEMAAVHPERVAGLALLDAYPPHQWRAMPPGMDIAPWQGLLLLAGLDPAEIEATRTSSGDGPPVGELRSCLRAAGSAVGAFDLDTLAAMMAVAGAVPNASRIHQPKPYDHPMHVFEAAAPRSETGLSVDGWREVGCSAVIRHRIDCTHPQMVEPGNLARILAALFDTGPLA